MSKELRDKGNEYFKTGDYVNAIKLYTQAIETDPSDHLNYSNRCAAYSAMQDFAKALADAQQSVTIVPSFAKGHARKAVALRQLGRLDESIAAYRDAIKNDQSNESYRVELNEVMELKNRQQSANMTNPLASLFGPNMIATLEANPTTRQLMANNTNLREALQEIQKDPNTIEKHLQNPLVMQCLQVLLGITPEMQMQAEQMRREEEEKEKRKKLEEENKPLFKGLPKMELATPTQEEPPQEEEDEYVDEELEREKAERRERRQKADAVKELGAAAYAKKDIDTALAHFTEAHNIDDTNPVYLMNIAACHFEKGEFQTAIDRCKEALETSGITFQQKGKCYLRMANSSMRLNNFQDAIEYYKRSILEDNTKLARDGLKKAEQAKKKWEEEAYLDDEKSEEAKELGNAEYKQGNYAKAIDYYTDAIKRNPKNYRVYSNRALCYTKVMLWDKALEDCDKCLSFNPKFVRAILRKGKVLHYLKNYAKALDCFKEALEIEPDDPEVIEAIQNTTRAIYESGTEQDQEERLKQAMNDPEVAALMRDPMVQQLLEDMSKDPVKAQKMMEKPEVARMVEKLVAAGVIRLG